MEQLLPKGIRTIGKDDFVTVPLSGVNWASVRELLANDTN